MEKINLIAYMMSQKLTFQTNLQCANCQARVADKLDAHPGLQHWDLDLDHADRILTVQGEGLSANELVTLIAKSGFKAVEIS